jgi:hypothetical protein
MKQCVRLAILDPLEMIFEVTDLTVHIEKDSKRLLECLKA